MNKNSEHNNDRYAVLGVIYRIGMDNILISQYLGASMA